MKEKEEIVCLVKKIIYHNMESGYSVLSVVSDSEAGQFSLCGILKGIPEGTVLHCQGEWKDHIMYGRQFIVDSWEEGEADEVKNFFSLPSRANRRPIYKTWGAFLKNNPGIAERVKYVTKVFLTEVEKDFDGADSDCVYYTVNVTAKVIAMYYAVVDGQKYSLLSCTFTNYESINEEFDDELDYYQIDALVEFGHLGDYARSHSRFYDIDDFDGLSNLDFHASGVPVCEDEMKERFYEEMAEESDEDDGDYTIDIMKIDLESALKKAFRDAGIDYNEAEYQCTSMFTSSKISGKLF